MDAILLIALGAGLFLAGMGIERTRRAMHDIEELEKRVKGMQAELEESRQLLVNRRVPYRVVEEVENEQARVVNDLLNAEEALERVRAAMGRTINVYGRLLDREPLEGNGRERHKVRAK